MQLLLEFLGRRRDAIVASWIEHTLQDYAREDSRYPLRGPGPFYNPVRHVLEESLPQLLDSLLRESPNEPEPALDAVIRMRAVQDFKPSQAVAFIFLLKEIVRMEAESARQIDPDCRAIADFETRIDRMALHAFDLFSRCREQICEIKVREAARRTFVVDRARARASDSEDPKPNTNNG